MARSGRYRFDEAFYLLTNPDVAQDVKAGLWATGYEHWVAHGAKEGRFPYPPWSDRRFPEFDEELYAKANPDVAEAIESGAVFSAFHHFVLHGWKEIAAGVRSGNPDQLVEVFGRMALRDRISGIIGSSHGKTIGYIREELDRWFEECVRLAPSNEVKKLVNGSDTDGNLT